MRTLGIALLCLSLVVLAGCKFRVTDLTSGNVYYTTKIKKLDSGTIRFRDARTRNRVRLSSSEVDRISGQAFREALEAYEAEASAGE